jgi:hypothetical protein
MLSRLERFVRDENIRNYKEQLRTETDPDRIRLLEALLRAEQAKDPGRRPSAPHKEA